MSAAHQAAHHVSAHSSQADHSQLHAYSFQNRFKRGLHLVAKARRIFSIRSEEHTSELQSHLNLVCRLLLEKKKTRKTKTHVAHNTITQPRHHPHHASTHTS